MTPFEKLKSIPAMVSFLKPSITLDSLEIESKHLFDNDAAEQLQQAKQQLRNQSSRGGSDGWPAGVGPPVCQKQMQVG